MKKLFLASFASVTLDLVEELLPKPANHINAAFIPTAGDPYENKDFVNVDKEAMIKLGMNVKEIDLKTVQGVQLKDALKDIDLILVAGGNTFYLLDYVRKSGFDKIVKKLVDKGVVYVGSSAGSIVCCPTIDGAKRFDPTSEAPDLIDYSGLNLVDFAIIPHTNKERYKERIDITTKELEDQGLEVIHLTDDQAVIVNGDSRKIVSIAK